MKRLLITVLMLISIIAFQNPSQAQEPEVGTVIFADTEETLAPVQSLLINELSYNMVRMHLFIAGKNIDEKNYEGEVLATIKRLEELTKTDVIEVLDVSTDRQQALSRYLIECSQELQEGDTISAYMRQEMQILQGDMNACLTDKNISDKAYFDAVDRYDQKLMESSLAQSIVYENCAAENRIQYNAKTSIAQKLVFYLGLLQKKYDLLFAKQDILAKNFEVFRDNILPDLNQIDQLLQQYKF